MSFYSIVTGIGGVARFGDRLLKRAEVERRVHMFQLDDVSIVPSNLQHHTGVIGAIAVAMQTTGMQASIADRPIQ